MTGDDLPQRVLPGRRIPTSGLYGKPIHSRGAEAFLCHRYEVEVAFHRLLQALVRDCCDRPLIYFSRLTRYIVEAHRD